MIQNSEKKKTAKILKNSNISLVGASLKYDVIVTSLPESGLKPVAYFYYHLCVFAIGTPQT